MADSKRIEGMKFNPDLSSLLTNHTSRYSLVIATARRARTIAEESEANGISLVEKPVSLALNELLNGEYVLVEPEEIRNI